MRLAVLIFACCLAACGGSGKSVTAIALRAEVSSSCTGDGGCLPPRVSVGHCGPDVVVPEGASEPVRVVTSRKPEEVRAAVVVRHSSGDLPLDAPNGGTSRGWMLLAGQTAAVEALHRPDVTLYSVDEAGAVGSLNAALLVSDGGVLEFRYSADGLAVVERHEVVEVSTRPLELTSPDDPFAACCAAVPGSWIAGALALASLLLRRRRA